MTERLRSFLPPWVLVSLIVHALLMLGASAGGGLIAGQGMPAGDGFGGDSIEIEIQGPTDAPPHGARAPSAAGQPAPAPQTEAQVTSSETTQLNSTDVTLERPVDEAQIEPSPETAQNETADGEHAAEPPPEHPPPRAPPQRPSPAQLAERPERPAAGDADSRVIDDPEATAEASPGDAPSPAGSGADGTTAGPPAGDVAGLILGSAGVTGSAVSPRQALLPNSGVCDDPVQGTWRAQKYRATDHTWVRFILRIQNQNGTLSGTILSRIWTGVRSDPRPGECTAFGMDHTWRMRARGRFGGDQMSFESVGRERLVAQHCPGGDGRYAPDHFRGRVQVMQEVWQSLNNDGAFDVDEPYTFRRVSCE